MLFRGRDQDSKRVNPRRKGALVSKVGNANKYARVRKEREAARDAALKEIIETFGAKQVKGFEAYFVCPNGDIFSTLNRRLLKISPGTKPSGYKFVGLHSAEKVSYCHVHRLVAVAFIENPDSLPEVNHKNGNKADNSACNLEWVTRSQNAKHALKTGLNPQKGVTSSSAKLNANQVRQIRDAQGRYKDIGKRFGVCAQTVCNVKRRSAYADV
jgi:hypothetical protein